jgi:hydrogenase nickel incorporation protein HypB
MNDEKTIQLMENIYAENDRLSDRLKQELNQSGVFTVNVLGAPGVGKTTAITNIIEKLSGRKPYVIEGDIASDIDTVKLKEKGIETVQINTYGGCHLDAPLISEAVKSFDFAPKSILFIENIGNLVCPAEFVIGEDIKLLILTVTEGSDKPYKYPLAFEKADVILLNKSDLLPYVDFDEPFFIKGVRALNKHAPIFYVSSREKESYNGVVKWIEERAEK